MAFDPRLGERFFFDSADLEANNRGVVSDAQEQGFEQIVRYNRRRDPKVTAFLVVLFAGAIALVVVGIARTPGGSLAGGAVAAGILVWILAIITFFRRRGRKLTAAFEQRRVLTAEGPLSIGGTISDTWRAEVGPARFGIELDQVEALEEGAVYRVHYLAAPDGAIPISMERL
jgi:hypothetical protein